MIKRLYDRDFGIPNVEKIGIKSETPAPAFGWYKTYALNYNDDIGADENADIADLSDSFKYHTKIICANGINNYIDAYEFVMVYDITQSSHHIELFVNDSYSEPVDDTVNYTYDNKTSSYLFKVAGCDIKHTASISIEDKLYDEFYDVCDNIIAVYDNISNMQFDDFTALLSKVKDTTLSDVLKDCYCLHVSPKVTYVFARLITQKILDMHFKDICCMPDIYNAEGYWENITCADCGCYDNQFSCILDSTDLNKAIDNDGDGIILKQCIDPDIYEPIMTWLTGKSEVPSIVNELLSDVMYQIINIIYAMDISEVIKVIAALYKNDWKTYKTLISDKIKPTPVSPAICSDYIKLFIIEKIVVYARYMEYANCVEEERVDYDASVDVINKETLHKLMDEFNSKITRPYSYLACFTNKQLNDMIRPVLDGNMNDDWRSLYEEDFKKITNPNLKLMYKLVIE